MKIGADAVFAVRFNDKVVMNAGIDIYTNFGCAIWEVFDYSDTAIVCGGIGTVPKIGLAIFR